MVIDAIYGKQAKTSRNASSRRESETSQSGSGDCPLVSMTFAKE